MIMLKKEREHELGIFRQRCCPNDNDDSHHRHPCHATSLTTTTTTFATTRATATAIASKMTTAICDDCKRQRWPRIQFEQQIVAFLYTQKSM